MRSVRDDRWTKWLIKEKPFDLEKSPAWKWLTAQYGPKIDRECLLSLGIICAEELGLTSLTRECKRRKKTMIKWFDENFDVVMPFLRSHVRTVKVDPVTLPEKSLPADVKSDK